MLRTLLRILAGVFFVIAGANHFWMTPVYLGMMPPSLPWPHALNAISGVAEILGGIGIVIPATRRAAGWGLMLLLIAVFPSNVHVALQGYMPGTTFSSAVLWWRLPFQIVFFVWVWFVALAPAPARSGPR